jgi:NAD+ synthase (glutamine-hydrolysing)
MILVDDGNFFETRYFSAWKHPREIDEFMLPAIIQEATGQNTVPIGCFILAFNDTSMAYEIGEEAWISNNPIIDAALDGAEIFLNPSASESERGKI